MSTPKSVTNNSTTSDQILLLPRQKIPASYNNINNNGSSNNFHKKTLSSPPHQTSNNNNNNNTTTVTYSSTSHSQPISINSSSSSKNNSSRSKNKYQSSYGSVKKINNNNDQVLSREIVDQQQQSKNQSSTIATDNETNSIDNSSSTRSRAKSFQNNPQFTPKQALVSSSKTIVNANNKLNVSTSAQSKSIPNSLNEKDAFEVSKSTLINGSYNSNSSSPSKYVKTMSPHQQRKKKQLLAEDNYSSSAPSKISINFDDTEEDNELLVEIMDDLCTRFVVNCPTSNSRVFETLFFDLEEAFWFYYDFHRVKHKTLPKYKFSMFCQKMFTRCPHLLDELLENDLSETDPSEINVDVLVQRFLNYKISVPVYGCIILNENLDKVLLVQGYNTKSWSFPKGKINQNEKESACAAREVYEECGYELGDRLVEQDCIEIEQNYDNSIVPDYKDKYKHSNPYTKLFIVGGIPDSTNFVTRTRKEILKIKWFSIKVLYETCYQTSTSKENEKLRTWLVKPFLNPLLDWINKKKPTLVKTPEKKPINRNSRSLTAPVIPNISVSAVVTQSNFQATGSPLLSFVFDTDEILEKK